MSKDTGDLSLTVGIPTANNEATIRETLESLANQTVQPDRIIVIDASTDATPDIVRAVDEETKVPIELHEQSSRGRGVGGARQDIYELLEEDVLACLDTDKRVGPEWVEKRLEFHHKHSEYDILSGTKSEGVDRPAEGPKDTDFLRQSNCSIRKSALDRVEGWDPWMSRGEDWDLRIRLWTSGAQSYIRGDIGCEFIKRDDPKLAFGKILSRPSSVDFLRKYGLWYLRFHPIQPLGDIASLCSLIAIPVALLLGTVWSPLALLLLLGPLLGSLTYLHVKGTQSRDPKSLTDLRLVHAVFAARFFLLGYTMVRQIVRSHDYDWNYGGFNPDRL
jgi:glycosyltransferase involved in cell wall biosynthesis